jgi:hypothetical protein
VCAALVDLQAPAGGYNLVTVHYAALPRTPGDDAIHTLMAAVAPGGTLLVVGHARIDPEHARAHGFDPADYVQPSDIAARLDHGWLVQVDEERPRVDPSPPSAEHVLDHVLRAPPGPGPQLGTGPETHGRRHDQTLLWATGVDLLSPVKITLGTFPLLTVCSQTRSSGLVFVCLR